MRIAFCGTHGVGKSTAAVHLTSLLKQNDRSKSVVCLEENIRFISKLTDNKLNTLLFLKLAFSDQLFRETNNELLHDIIVTDRTLFDYIVYAQVEGTKPPKVYLNLALDHLSTFKCIYLVSPDNLKSNITDDGFRDTNKTYRNQIDSEFKCMLELNFIKYKELKSSEILSYDYLKDLNAAI